MKHFINDRASIVTEAIDLEVMLSEGKLLRLEGAPAIKVVVRADWDKSKVAVISGGGAGHEPAHAGFVGDGLLTAAVCGEIFASPSVDAVLAAILAVAGDAGALLIVKNYTGDRLNFGLAAEKARALGRAVEMVVVADDIAIPDATRPRGLAGTLFVHKIAGHHARAGASLADVKAAAERAASAVRSLGVALTSCTIPGQNAENRIGPAEVELGLGIHGEPGASIIAHGPIDALAKAMVARLAAALGDAKHPVALLLNDLGGVPPIEMAVTARAVLEAMKETKREVALVFGPARLMTSLDMKGFSISALPVDAETLHALESPVGPTAWPRGRRVGTAPPVPLTRATKPAAHAPSANPARRRVVETVCRTLIARESELDALDAKVGDGDTGTTFATAARAVLADLDRLPFAEASALCTSIADRLSTVMGGSSGILLAIGVSSMGAAVGDAPDWARALRAGVQRIQQVGGAEEGDRTMLDALLPAALALEQRESAQAVATAARRGADLTSTMTKARSGRSSYVPEDALRGVPDPGAVAIACIFEALAAQ